MPPNGAAALRVPFLELKLEYFEDPAYIASPAEDPRSAAPADAGQNGQGAFGATREREVSPDSLLRVSVQTTMAPSSLRTPAWDALHRSARKGRALREDHPGRPGAGPPPACSPRRGEHHRCLVAVEQQVDSPQGGLSASNAGNRWSEAARPAVPGERPGVPPSHRWPTCGRAGHLRARGRQGRSVDRRSWRSSNRRRGPRSAPTSRRFPAHKRMSPGFVRSQPAFSVPSSSRTASTTWRPSVWARSRGP